MNETIMNSREVQTKWSTILDSVANGVTNIVVERDSTRVAVILNYEKFVAILQELEDCRDGRLAMVELDAWKKDPSTAQLWEEIKAEMIAESLLDES